MKKVITVVLALFLLIGGCSIFSSDTSKETDENNYIESKEDNDNNTSLKQVVVDDFEADFRKNFNRIKKEQKAEHLNLRFIETAKSDNPNYETIHFYRVSSGVKMGLGITSDNKIGNVSFFIENTGDMQGALIGYFSAVYTLDSTITYEEAYLGLDRAISGSQNSSDREHGDALGDNIYLFVKDNGELVLIYLGLMGNEVEVY